MGIDHITFRQLLHCLDQFCGIASAAQLRRCFQRLQKQTVLIRLQTKGAAVCAVFHPHRIKSPLCRKKYLLQVLIKILLRLKQPLCGIRKSIRFLPIALNIHFHQFPEMEIPQPPRHK